MLARIRLWQIVGVLLLASSSFAFQSDDEKAAKLKEETKKIQGKWEITSFLKGGEELDAIVKLGMELTFKDDTLIVKAADLDVAQRSLFFQVDPSCDPKLIDFADSAKELKEKKQMIECVYTLDGDELKICYNSSGDEPAKANRPAKVESKSGSESVVVTFKRVKG